MFGEEGAQMTDLHREIAQVHVSRRQNSGDYLREGRR